MDFPSYKMVIFHSYVSVPEGKPRRWKHPSPLFFLANHLFNCRLSPLSLPGNDHRKTGGFSDGAPVGCPPELWPPPWPAACWSWRRHGDLGTVVLMEKMTRSVDVWWCLWGLRCTLPSAERLHSNGKSPFLMGKSTISMAMFNCYVSSPEGSRYCFFVKRIIYQLHLAIGSFIDPILELGVWFHRGAATSDGWEGYGALKVLGSKHQHASLRPTPRVSSRCILIQYFYPLVN